MAPNRHRHVCYLRPLKRFTTEHDSSLEPTWRDTSISEVGLVGGGFARARHSAGDVSRVLREALSCIFRRGGQFKTLPTAQTFHRKKAPVSCFLVGICGGRVLSRLTPPGICFCQINHGSRGRCIRPALKYLKTSLKKSHGHYR